MMVSSRIPLLVYVLQLRPEDRKPFLDSLRLFCARTGVREWRSP